MQKKVDSLSKEFERRVLAFQKAENKITDSKLSEKPEPDISHTVEYLESCKELLEKFKKKLACARGHPKWIRDRLGYHLSH